MISRDNPSIDTTCLRTRRVVFWTAFFVLYSALLWAMADLLWHLGMMPLEWAQLALFAVLAFPLCVGFLMSMAGFLLEARGGDNRTITRLSGLNNTPDPGQLRSRTAIIMPVFNEDAGMIFERVRIMYRSLENLGHLQNFDFFVLSDSNNPQCWITEEAAWMELCRQLNAFGKIFYRKRRLAINKKSGNVADFCRRWGKSYDFMITLDADSLMEGDAMAKLALLMEKNPCFGIIQTAPTLVRGSSLFARISQFVVSFYGRIFCAGLNYWQQGNGMYWGYNAILRLEPFIENCDLPTLPGSVPFGGHILSRDFVEAALMQRAGYQVWLAYDIVGTYEEGPPTWIDFIKRDRRWCAGNLQHFWLLFSLDLNTVNRLQLLLGVLSYVTSPLWLSYLAISTLQYFENLRGGDATKQSLISRALGEEIQQSADLVLFLLVVFLLAAPRLLAWLLAGIKGLWKMYGGAARSLVSVLLELLLSSLAAPVHMMMNSKFVIFTELGQTVTWGAQNRQCGDGTSWREAWQFHFGQVALAALLALYFSLDARELLLWVSPLLLGLALSVPLSVWSSRQSVGNFFRRLGLFLTPEETSSSALLQRFEQNVETLQNRQSTQPATEPTDKIISAIVDPYLNAAHVILLRRRGQRPQKINDYIQSLCDKLISEGLGALQKRELNAVLQDAHGMEWLHHKVWSWPAEKLHPSLRESLHKYNLLQPEPQSPLYR